MNKVITISRQYASGGRTIGKMVAQELGIPLYDSEIIKDTMKKTGLSSDMIEAAEQRVTNSFLFNLAMGVDDAHNQMKQIEKAEHEIIQEYVKKGPCVIVGRCADYVLKNTETELLRVFIYADEKDRIHRIVHEYGETDVKPEKRLREKDKRRKAYYEVYTDQKFGDPVNYDMCLNTSGLGIEGCVDLIEQVYKKA